MNFNVFSNLQNILYNVTTLFVKANSVKQSSIGFESLRLEYLENGRALLVLL